MKALLKQLWFQSGNCEHPIKNMGIQISEVSKSTNKSHTELIKYLKLLLKENYMLKISEEPLLFQFSESGKLIKTDKDIEVVIIDLNKTVVPKGL